ncbi:hypothetical protein E4U12_001349 [Claviceps purpurea]|nr:hypothetical protein E4U12_001349 [Claviceps purpurea]
MKTTIFLFSLLSIGASALPEPEEVVIFDGKHTYRQCSQWVVSPMVWFSIYQWLASGVVYRPHTNGVVWYGVPGGHTMGHHGVPKGEAAKPNRAKRIFFRQAV